MFRLAVDESWLKGMEQELLRSHSVLETVEQPTPAEII
jgi:hypothetical protein